jgi:hypothetical protein
MSQGEKRMFSEFLATVLTRTSHAPDGCGMSTRPDFYSGRGAITADLDDTILEKLWTAIKANRGDEAAAAFVLMVEAIPVLSATDFLITLAALDRNDYAWDARFVSGAKGIDIRRDDDGRHNGVSAVCTMAAMLGRGDRDETAWIRNPFLRRHVFDNDGALVNVAAKE